MDGGADERHHFRRDERREREEGQQQGLIAHGGEDREGEVAPEDSLVREVPGVESELYIRYAMYAHG